MAKLGLMKSLSTLSSPLEGAASLMTFNSTFVLSNYENARFAALHYHLGHIAGGTADSSATDPSESAMVS